MTQTLLQPLIPHRTSGGETAMRERMLALRAKIFAEEDVHSVLALSWNEELGKWLYMIQTPFATWPKYVIGYTDDENDNPEILFRCGREMSAVQYWEDHNLGKHQ